MRPGIGPSSFYDPISAGSSRRSSQLSTATTGGTCIPPPPPSHLLAGQLQKIQSTSTKTTGNLVLQTQNVSLQQAALQQTWLSNNFPDSLTQSSNTVNTDTRRMSEPCHTLSDRKSPPPRPASVSLSPLKTPVDDIHPNQAVVLDEVGEGEMVENKLVIPDEMVHYLNQVADTQNGDFNSMHTQNGDFNSVQWSENRETSNVDQKQASSTNQMIGSPPTQIVPSPSQNFANMVPSPQNTNVLSPSAVNQIMPSPGSMILPSPTSTMNQMMPSPASNMNHMMPSPSANMNQMMPSPVSNFNQMLASPASNYGNVQNPMVSPAPTMNQMMPSPQTNMNHIPVQSPMSVRCQSQMMSPDTTNMMMQSPAHPMPNNGQLMQQNCGMLSQNAQMTMAQCYNRPVNHNMCYVQHGGDNTWNNNMQMQQNRMCQNPNQMQHNLTMCHSTSTNVDYNNQCRPQMQQTNNTYMNSAMQIPSQNQCNNHNHQMCSTNNYAGCHTNKHMNNYTCNPNTYSQGYSCIPNINEPLTSPAMAAPAPNDTINQPQQAQMSRPCAHYNQNCYRYNNQCNQNTMCNCVKMNIYPHASNNKCFHQCSNNSEIQCKDISQSQMSPGVVVNSSVPMKNTNGGNGTQPYGMRQDAYQRTLEYVQNCQSWVNTSSSEMFSSTANSVVKCADTTNSNMVVNDMTSSLSSLLEENRYLQMIQ